jgi:branched-subunit amino acid aminotransferase/4-amino-4-deoxychorismate lyase
MNIWLNGEFLERDEAKVSVFDAGLQHAVGLFETMAAHHGRIFRAEAHLQRLLESARELLLTDRLRLRPLAEALHLTLQRNEMEEARVRLTVTGGDLNYLQSKGRGKVDPTILIVAQPPTAYPELFLTDGVRVTIADARDNPFDPGAGHKTVTYWPRIRALQEAAARGAGESLWFSVSNHLSGGSVSNAFLIKDGSLLTPIARGEEEQGAIPASVLPGITRAAVIELAEEQGLEASRRMLDIEDVLAADEVFLTNSSWGILPVTAVEGKAIADGKVGPATRCLRDALIDLVERETAAGGG